MKRIILYTSMLIIFLFSTQHSFSYELKVKNFNYVAANILEFEIFIKGPTPQLYCMGQYIFNFNPAFANGGNLTYTKLNFSNLPPANRPSYAAIFNGQLRLSTNLPNAELPPVTISNTGDGTKIIRMRLTTTACSFAGNLNLTWRNASDGGYYTKVYDAVTEYFDPNDPESGSYFVSITNITNPASHSVDPIPPPGIANVLVSPGCGVFPTLKDAFSAINTNTGGIYTNQNVTVSIVNNTTETSPAVLNGGIFGTCIIKPVNNSIAVTAASGATDLIVLNGADNVTLDGRVGGAGANQLTVDGNNISQSCIKLTNAATNNFIRYVNSINASDNNIYLAETNTTGNDNNTFEYNLINQGIRGISLSGNSETVSSTMNSGNQIRFNEIKNIKESGIQMSRNTQNNTIEGNQIHNENVLTGTFFYGINISATGTNNILRNKIYNVAGTGSNTAYFGIRCLPVGKLSVTVNAAINIINNFISMVDDNSNYMYGIYLGSSGIAEYVRQTTSVNHNTIYIGKNSSSSDFSSTGIGMYIEGKTGEECIYNQYNNVSVNERTYISLSQLASDIQILPGVIKNIDYNSYWSNNLVTQWNTSSYSNETAYRTAASPNEQNTIFKNADFADKLAGDLHLSGASVSDYDLIGKSGTGVTNDFDLDTRDVLFPYKGADESAPLSNSGGATTLNLKCYEEGFYRSASHLMAKNIPATIIIKRAVSPYNVISTNSTVLDVNGNASSLNFNIPYPGSYYILVKNWNMLSTWTADPQNFTVGGTTSYDFSAAQNNAYGNNMPQIDASPLRWGMFAGDVNQDEIINNTDVTAIHDASVIYSIGNIVTDLNGDEVIDADDLAIARNNEANSIHVVKP